MAHVPRNRFSIVSTDVCGLRYVWLFGGNSVVLRTVLAWESCALRRFIEELAGR